MLHRLVEPGTNDSKFTRQAGDGCVLVSRPDEPGGSPVDEGLTRRGFLTVLGASLTAAGRELLSEGRVLLRAETRFEEVVHLPCLNAAPAYIAALADAIV